jgi:DNA transposition AAA+ family ATPase
MMELDDFVETSVYRAIEATVKTGLDLQQNVALDGPAGSGKGCALRYLFDCRDGPSRMFTVDAAIGHNTTYLIQQLCESYNIGAGQSRAISFGRFIKHARDYFYNERQVVVFDEAQNMKLETVKDIANLSTDHGLNITFVFCGNRDILNITKSTSAAFLQLDRRIKVRKSIKSLEPGDADAIVQAFGTDDAEVRRMARAIGEHFYIDGIVTVLQNAQRIADGKPIRAQHVRDVVDDYFPQYRAAITTKAVRTAVA